MRLYFGVAEGYAVKSALNLTLLVLFTLVSFYKSSL